MHLHTAYTQPGCVVLYHQVFIGMVCDVRVSECIHTHTQNQRFPEMRAAHVITNNWKIPLECPRSTWEELKDASESVVWKGRKSRMVNRKTWFVAWARHGSLCSRLSRGEGSPAWKPVFHLALESIRMSLLLFMFNFQVANLRWL